MLIQVAISIAVLMAFTVFVCDYGVVWVSRGQAQNAADAGALAGALARAYDETGDPAAGGVTETAARTAAQQNLVWSAAGAVNVTYDCPTGVAGRCVRADVYRNGEFGSSTLPTFFGGLLGITSQGVRATATARVVFANATDCMRPWGVADKWLHEGTPLEVAPIDRYDRWQKKGSGFEELNPHDVYTPADSTGAGTGYRLPEDYGFEVTLKLGNPSSSDGIQPGWFLPIDLPDGAGGYTSGGDDYRDAIATCIGQPVAIGTYLPTEEGVMIGPTKQGTDDLFAKDPGASWDPSTRTVTGSCAPTCAPFSPRIVPLPVFDIDQFQKSSVTGEWSQCPGGGKCVKVVNILGFFADRISAGGDITGYLVSYPGIFVAGAPSVGEDASFLATVQLVR